MIDIYRDSLDTGTEGDVVFVLTKQTDFVFVGVASSDKFPLP